MFILGTYALTSAITTIINYDKKYTAEYNAFMNSNNIK